MPVVALVTALTGGNTTNASHTASIAARVGPERPARPNGGGHRTLNRALDRTRLSGDPPSLTAHRLPHSGARVSRDVVPERSAQEAHHQERPERRPDEQRAQRAPVERGTVVKRVERVLQGARERLDREHGGDP